MLAAPARAVRQHPRRRRPARRRDGRDGAAHTPSPPPCALRRAPFRRTVRRHRRAGVDQQASSRRPTPTRTGARSGGASAPSGASRCGGPRRPARSRGGRSAGCRRRRGARSCARPARAPGGRSAAARRRARRIAAPARRQRRAGSEARRRHPSITEASVASASRPSSSLSRRRRTRWRSTGSATACEIVDVDVRAAGHHRAHARRAHQRLQRARAGAVADVAPRVRRRRRPGPAGWRRSGRPPRPCSASPSSTVRQSSAIRSTSAGSAIGSQRVGRLGVERDLEHAVQATRALGNGTVSLNMKRSSCASGSG